MPYHKVYYLLQIVLFTLENEQLYTLLTLINLFVCKLNNFNYLNI